MGVSYKHIIALLIPLKSVFAFGVLTCQCLTVKNAYIVTRLWEIVNPNWTDKAVFQQFQQGFAQNITTYNGFKEYISAFTGNSSRPFFFNVFDTADEAALAQAAAREFGSKGVLNGVISPYEFHQGVIKFWTSSSNCVFQPKTGQYLSTRLWRLLPNSSLTAQDVVDIVVSGFVPNITKANGFLEYGIVVLSDSDSRLLFYNVFETEEFARASNVAAVNFVANSALNGKFEKIVFTEGPVHFDYTCAAKEDPRTIPPVRAKTAAPTRPFTKLYSGSPMVILGIALPILTLHSTFMLFD